MLFLRSIGNPDVYFLYSHGGDRLPLHANSMGKVLMAYAHAEDVKRIMRNCERFTPNTITNLTMMNRELARIRAKGLARNNEEWAIGLRSVAAPIWDQDGHVVAAISIGGPTPQMPDSEMERYGKLVKQAGLKISAQLGYRTMPREVGTDRRPKRLPSGAPKVTFRKA
jgi:IclR family acetate operon transcriptional repressor